MKAIVFASLGALTLTVALMWMLGYTPAFLPKVFGGTDNPIIPLTKVTTIYQAYTFFSVGHAIDLINLFFIVQPTAVILLFAGGWFKQKQEKRTDEKIFLVLMMVFGIIFISIITCWLGMNRDWDALSVFSSGVSVAAIYGWFYETKETRIRRELLAAITVVALVQTGLWIGINAKEASALQRIDILREDPRLSEIGVCAYAEARGKYHWVRKEYAKAAQCYERAVALEPNYRFLSQLASMNNAMGQYSKSLELYKRMEALGQANGKIYSNMGILYLQSHQYDNALKYLHIAETLDSLSAHIPLHIGTAIAIRENSYEKGLPYFLRAIKLDPFYSLAYYNASSCYKEMGDTVMAQKYYERFTELSRTRPRSTSAGTNNLF
jgi:Tfp pilus assembly protein PilF